MQEVNKNVTAIREALGPDFPPTAIILGSGFGPFIDRLSDRREVSYANIPHFHQPTVEGHAGRLVIGKSGMVEIACLQGRGHLYEGHSPSSLAIPVRTLRRLGVKTLVLTNAAGSLDPQMPPSSLMMIRDHINLTGLNPLIGPNDETFGPRFPDMTEAWDKDLQQQLQESATRTSTKLFTGVYVQVSGPNFETPAEITMLRTLGADAVGMSTVPEALAARHCGMRIAGLSIITNMGAGMGETKLSHEQTLKSATGALDNATNLLTAFLDQIE